MVVMLQQQHVRIILVALRVLAILVMNLLQDHRPCVKVSVYIWYYFSIAAILVHVLCKQISMSVRL